MAQQPRFNRFTGYLDLGLSFVKAHAPALAKYFTLNLEFFFALVAKVIEADAKQEQLKKSAQAETKRLTTALRQVYDEARGAVEVARGVLRRAGRHDLLTLLPRVGSRKSLAARLGWLESLAEFLKQNADKLRNYAEVDPKPLLEHIGQVLEVQRGRDAMQHEQIELTTFVRANLRQAMSIVAAAVELTVVFLRVEGRLVEAQRAPRQPRLPRRVGGGASTESPAGQGPA